MDSPASGAIPQSVPERFSLRALLFYFLRLGTLGFGGPIALGTLALLLAPRRIPEPVLIVAAGVVGLLLKGAGAGPR